MKLSAMQNFHLPLPDELYRELKNESKRSGTPATQIARIAVAEWLKKQHAIAVHEELSAYAAAVAGTEHDLDSELAEAAIDRLRDVENEQ